MLYSSFGTWMMVNAYIAIFFPGFLDFMISAHPIAETLREYIAVKIVPMINPDGVFIGNYR